jgi:hypothetical protein
MTNEHMIVHGLRAHLLTIGEDKNADGKPLFTIEYDGETVMVFKTLKELDAHIKKIRSRHHL